MQSSQDFLDANDLYTPPSVTQPEIWTLMHLRYSQSLLLTRDTGDTESLAGHRLVHPHNAIVITISGEANQEQPDRSMIKIGAAQHV